MDDEPSDLPERPDPMHRTVLIEDVDCFTANLLEEWLQEKASKEKSKVKGDIFTREISAFLRQKMGRNKVQEKYKQYQINQSILRGNFIRYCNQTGYDPDTNTFENKSSDIDSELDL